VRSRVRADQIERNGGGGEGRGTRAHVCTARAAFNKVSRGRRDGVPFLPT
jgi:hypothetical protein